MKLLLADKKTIVFNNDLSFDIFKNYGELKAYDNISREELLNEVTDSDIILCNKTLIDEEVFKVAKKLRYIGLFATGYNNIDIVSAKKYGVTVCNAGVYSTNAVAQQVMGYILMYYTAIPKYNDFVKNNGWIKSDVFSPLFYPTEELFGKTLGIVGYGSIGKTVEKIAKSFGMNVIVYTRTIPFSDDKFVSFDELLRKSDIVTLHCPLNKQSEDMMNNDAFNKMKRGAFFINTSRGGTVDENALYNALKNGHLSGAAVDVLKQEPMSKDCPLLSLDNIIITPHTSWAPLKTRQRLLEIVSKNVECFIDGNPQNVIV